MWELLSDGLNHWLLTWGKDQVSPGSTGEGNSPVRQEGGEPGWTSLTSHVRADCHRGRISFWRSLPGEAPPCEPTTFWYGGTVFFPSIIAPFYCTGPSVITPLLQCLSHCIGLSNCYTCLYKFKPIAFGHFGSMYVVSVYKQCLLSHSIRNVQIFILFPLTRVALFISILLVEMKKAYLIIEDCTTPHF